MRQPKRAALLTVMAAGAENGVRTRDKLLAMFWPDVPASKARHSLTQAIYALRRDLGDQVFTRYGDHPAVDPAGLWCDVPAFKKAVDEERNADAMHLYRGDFLDGLFLSGCPAFEQWVDAEREELRRMASRAAWAVAVQLKLDNRLADAAAAAQRAAGLTPLDEPAQQRLICFLDEIGDRSGAVAVYEAFAERIGTELDLDPSTETVALIKDVRARSSDEQPPLSGLAPDTDFSSPEQADRFPSSQGSDRSRPRRVLAGLAVVFGIMLVPTVWSLTRASVLDPHRVAVMPVENLALTADAGIGAAVAGLLVSELSQYTKLHIVAQSAIASEGADVKRVVESYRVGTLVEGQLGDETGALTIDLRVVDAATMRVVGRAAFRSNTTDGIDPQTTKAMVRFVVARIGTGLRERYLRDRAPSESAWRALAAADGLRGRGRTLAHGGRARVAWAQFAEADSLLAATERGAGGWIEPVIARGWLAHEQFQAIREADPVPEQPPGPAGALALGTERLRAAIDHAERALTAERGDPRALELRGTARFSLWTITGRTDDTLAAGAEEDLSRAVAAAPTLSHAWLRIAEMRRNRGDVEGSYVATNTAMANDIYLDPAQQSSVGTYQAEPAALYSRMMDAMEIGLDREARQDCALGQRLFPEHRMFVECELALLSWTAQNPADADRAWTLYQQIEGTSLPWLTDTRELRRAYVAAVLARVGHEDSARAVLGEIPELFPSNGPDSLAAAVARIRVLGWLGDAPSAVAALDSLIQLFPGMTRRIPQHPTYAALRQTPVFGSWVDSLRTAGILTAR